MRTITSVCKSHWGAIYLITFIRPFAYTPKGRYRERKGGGPSSTFLHLHTRGRMDKAVALKGLAFSICFACFVLNSYNTLTQFLRQDTITMTDVVSYPTMKLPVYTICSQRGIKSKGYDLANHAEYDLATYGLADLMVTIGSPSNFTDNSLAAFRNVTTLRTAMRGRCYVYEYPFEVSRD